MVQIPKLIEIDLSIGVTTFQWRRPGRGVSVWSPPIWWNWVDTERLIHSLSVNVCCAGKVGWGFSDLMLSAPAGDGWLGSTGFWICRQLKCEDYIKHLVFPLPFSSQPRKGLRYWSQPAVSWKWTCTTTEPGSGLKPSKQLTCQYLSGSDWISISSVQALASVRIERVGGRLGLVEQMFINKRLEVTWQRERRNERSIDKQTDLESWVLFPTRFVLAEWSLAPCYPSCG